jgi:hypothetical protein
MTKARKERSSAFPVCQHFFSCGQFDRRGERPRSNADDRVVCRCGSPHCARLHCSMRREKKVHPQIPRPKTRDRPDLPSRPLDKVRRRRPKLCPARPSPCSHSRKKAALQASLRRLGSEATPSVTANAFGWRDVPAPADLGVALAADRCDTATRILRNVRRAIRPDGRLVASFSRAAMTLTRAAGSTCTCW